MKYGANLGVKINIFVRNNEAAGKVDIILKCFSEIHDKLGPAGNVKTKFKYSAIMKFGIEILSQLYICGVQNRYFAFS